MRFLTATPAAIGDSRGIPGRDPKPYRLSVQEEKAAPPGLSNGDARGDDRPPQAGSPYAQVIPVGRAAQAESRPTTGWRYHRSRPPAVWGSWGSGRDPARPPCGPRSRPLAKGVDCFGIQVKGGENSVAGASWLLHTVAGKEPVPRPQPAEPGRRAGHQDGGQVQGASPDVRAPDPAIPRHAAGRGYPESGRVRRPRIPVVGIGKPG